MQDPRDHKDLQDQEESQARMDSQDNPDLLDQPDNGERTEPQGLRVRKGLQDPVGRLEHLVGMVPLDSAENLDLPDLRVDPGLLDHRDPVDSADLLESAVNPDSEERPDHKDLRDLQETTVRDFIAFRVQKTWQKLWMCVKRRGKLDWEFFSGGILFWPSNLNQCLNCEP